MISAHPGTYEEQGWARAFIGQHPSSGQVNRYFLTASLLHVCIAAALPPGWRTGWQLIGISVEYNTIQANRQMGLGIKVGF